MELNEACRVIEHFIEKYRNASSVMNGLFPALETLLQHVSVMARIKEHQNEITKLRKEAGLD